MAVAGCIADTCQKSVKKKVGIGMVFLSAAHTDVGITKKINQDAFGLKIASYKGRNIAFAILCDGMGGLKCGELASAFVVNAYSKWFEEELPQMLSTGRVDLEKIGQRWGSIAKEQGRKIMDYGKQRGVSMGTTLSAILIVENAYIFIQVGDSRIYNVNSDIVQITKDQTVVAREVELGRLTPEQAEKDGRKNVLLQCVGASQTIVPELKSGTVKNGDVFLLCSDGFRHKVKKEEMLGVVSSRLLTDEKVMKKSLIDLIELNKRRQETDNITAILLKAVG